VWGEAREFSQRLKACAHDSARWEEEEIDNASARGNTAGALSFEDSYDVDGCSIKPRSTRQRK
jgi:hypothetical protein